MNNTQRYIRSSLITFVTGFALAIYPLLDDLTLNGLTRSVLLGLLFAGVRAGIKALIEYFFVREKTAIID